ncbi:MAG: DUF370 domain-containing protein [Clostridia bacterium]|nr:DUF370 domain-containing protein [Clostridia bacterium]MEE1025067.1 DUF370 domain-containing protein [Acutalibacteraceae bacterium]
MYLYLGGDVVVKNEDIIGVFDIDTTTVSKASRNYLNNSEKSGRLTYVSYELPKSFVVCSKDNKETVYISQISSATLEKRAKSFLPKGDY